METPASVAKHPIHPMLIVFPIGLWVFSLASDLIFLITREASWQSAAFYTMVGGLIGALLAAVPGLIDFLSIKEQRMKTVARLHMGINLTLVGLYAINIWLRTRGVDDWPLRLSVLTVLMLVVSGWLGGKLVYTQGVGVEPAHHDDRVRAHT